MNTLKRINNIRSGLVFSKRLALLLALFWVMNGHGQAVSETVLHQFSAGQNDGASPYSGLISGNDGALYGTTWSGGTNASGTVFRMNKGGGNFTILHHFGAANDGSTPYSSLVQANDGLLYGTTYYGGTNSDGTIFKLDPGNLNYSVIYRFTNSPDGANPYAGLIQGLDGALYGTTYSGGSNQGTVFKINLDGGGYSVLHTFTNFGDGTLPYGGLVQASNGVLYGTTMQGGSNVLGTVFTITTNGGGYSAVHSFGGIPNGGTLECSVLLGSDGWLYGTTVIGGTKGFGSVFKVNTNGSGFATLHSFTNSPDGANGYASLAQGSDGALYGVTTWGGKTNLGTVFKMNTDGNNYSVLYNFTGSGGDGMHPYAGMIAAGTGVFYGTTLQGGTNEFGTVFRLALVPTLAVSAIAQGVPQITLSGLAGQPCQVQVSSNLVNWDVLATLSLTNGAVQVADPAATNFPSRFYRALLP